MHNPVLQQCLQISYDHIINQGCASIASIASGSVLSRCAYDNGNGHGCAAAPFIKKYDPSMEDICFSKLVTDKDLKFSSDHFMDIVFQDDSAIRFINNVLQPAHDRAASHRKNDIFIEEYKILLADRVANWNRTEVDKVEMVE